MESTCLHLKVMSCSDLKTFHLFQKLSARCIVSIVEVGTDGKKIRKESILEQKETERDCTGGRNPEWNHHMKFDLTNLPLDSGRFYVRFDIRAASLIAGRRTIGEVCVPIKDLIAESKGAAEARYVKYQIRSLHGRSNGVISFSHKVIFNGKKSDESCIKETNSLQGNGFSSEKTKHPKVEKTVFYPVIDDQYNNPLQGKSFKSHKLYYRSLELHDQSIPFSSHPPVACYASQPPMYFQSLPPSPYHPMAPSPYHPMVPPSPYHAVASNYAVRGGYGGY